MNDTTNRTTPGATLAGSPVPPPGRSLGAAQARAGFWPLWVASVALPLLVLAGAGSLAWARARATAEAGLRTSVGVLQEHALRAFQTQEALVAAMQWRSRGLSWDEIAASTDIAQMLRYLLDHAPGTSNIGMVAPDGRLVQISNVPFPPPPLDFSDRDYVRHQQGPAPGPFVSLPLTGRLRGNPAFNYSRPRLDETGRPDGGVLWVTFRPRDFSAFYAGTAGGTRDEIALLRSRDGAILASHPPARQPGAGPPAVPPEADGMALATRRAAEAPGRLVLAEGVSPLDGRPRLYAALALTGAPVTVLRGLDPDGPLSAWRQEVAGMAAMAGASALALLWLTRLARGSARREVLALAQGRLEAELRAEAEAALRQRQRLEALGEVAAGVAHDFRNTVQAVQGGATLARKALETGDTGRALKLLGMLAEVAGRGAALTERMLRATRRADREGRPGAAALDPAAAVAAASDFFSRLLPAGCRIACDIRAEGLPARVAGDPAELESALLNLVLNARDAMPGGGTIALTLAAEPAEGEGRPAELRPGLAHARIVVADSGIGMDEATLARIAEPFFTTKPPGKGTGLGLASVRAFVRGAGGVLRIESPGPGQGTTVTLWLPEAPAWSAGQA